MHCLGQAKTKCMEDHTFTRRGFLGLVASAFAGARTSAAEPICSVQKRTLRVGMVLPVADGALAVKARDISSGITLALAETQRSGQLFGQMIVLVERHVATAQTGDASAIASAARELVAQSSPAVLIAGTSAAECSAVARLSAEKQILSFNVSSAADFLRMQDCGRSNMYHVAASNAMIAGAKASAATLAPAATMELWHGSLERYGATQLNDRYAARFRRPMTSFAWAGWMAVKVAWETSLRAQSVEPAGILAALGEERTQFDGHKGAPLSFRTWDNQLRQPLYAVAPDAAGGRVVAEFPDVGRNNEESMRDQLDRFGAGRTVTCPSRVGAETRSTERITGASPEESR
jgi:ABC-type branched-subunit amino acid transport system substrate-binding protein